MFSTLMARTAALTVALYFTNRVGIWGNTDASDKLYQHISKRLEPVRQMIPELSKTEIGLIARKYYEFSIKEGYQLMRQLPDYKGQLLELAKSWPKRSKKNKMQQEEGTTSDEEVFNWLPVLTVAVVDNDNDNDDDNDNDNDETSECAVTASNHATCNTRNT
ncbi:MICOS complex subunit MIC13 homolog QIL1 [Drosophila innubila]|uniref:MICOS complex subunit MIC13 homolog QIL1 n=1 Tax=Drosophila innubila TaxID=198719 RepID=UPI00148CA3DF|nr:MICOS complex subunit MIC13 homolog QIL1 [Drosophila innubila]